MSTLPFLASLYSTNAEYNSSAASTSRRSSATTTASSSKSKRTKRDKRLPAYSSEHEQYLLESWEELVDSAPAKDADAEEVGTWLLKVLHRRCHPCPVQVTNDIRWTGRELHRKSYIATRHRFRSEPDGVLIAHDLHDAVKQARRKRRALKKKQSKIPAQGAAQSNEDELLQAERTGAGEGTVI